MRYPYSEVFSPPAPVVPLEVFVPDAPQLLGRDALNHFYVHLNGPELTFALDLSP